MSQEEAQIATQVENENDFKVFVGNIDFHTTQEEFQQYFSKNNAVVKAKIITRGTRSLGFGFVTYETLTHAEAAVKSFDKSTLGAREINVEIAKPQVERPPKERKPKKASTATSLADASADGANNDADNAPEAADATGDVKPRTGRSRASRNKNKKARAEGEEGSGAQEHLADSDKDAPNGEGSKSVRHRRSRRTRRGATPATGVSGEDSNGISAPPRSVGPPSTTTVFVANVPYAMDDEGLKEVFKDFKVDSAHIVRRRRTGRSKGFGFVELADEAEQQKVIEKMNGATADGRPLVIRIALSQGHPLTPPNEEDIEGTTPSVVKTTEVPVVSATAASTKEKTETKA